MNCSLPWRSCCKKRETIRTIITVIITIIAVSIKAKKWTLAPKGFLAFFCTPRAGEIFIERERLAYKHSVKTTLIRHLNYNPRAMNVRYSILTISLLRISVKWSENLGHVILPSVIVVTKMYLRKDLKW